MKRKEYIKAYRNIRDYNIKSIKYIYTLCYD